MCQESLARPPPLGCRQAQAANVFSIRTHSFEMVQQSREKCDRPNVPYRARFGHFSVTVDFRREVLSAGLQ